MANVFTEVIHNSFWDRIKNALGGVVSGVVYIIAASIALVYGEYHHAKTTNVLKKVESKVYSINSKVIETGDNNKLVLIHDSIQSQEMLLDTLHAIQGPFIKLYRQVKMCQWMEKITQKTTEKSFGATVDSFTYEYIKVWDSKLHNSQNYRLKDRYSNPTSMIYTPATYQTKHLQMGVFEIDSTIIAEIKLFRPIKPSEFSTSRNIVFATDTFNCLGDEAASDGAIYSNYMLNGEYIFKGKGTPEKPEIGDYKFVYWAVYPGDYTLIAQQNNTHMKAYPIEDGFAVSELNCGINFNYINNNLFLLRSGKHAKNEMFSWAHENNDHLWVIACRLWGFIFMVAGFKRLFKPLAIMPTWIPVVGNYAGKTILRFSFFIATTLTFIIAGATWLIFNNFNNITHWDYYFLILVFLIATGSIRVYASMGSNSVDSGDFFNLNRN
jgi:hypothetical protein